MGPLSRLLSRSRVLWRGPSPTSAPRAPARPAPMPNHLRERPRSASSPGAWARLLERTRVLWRGPSPTSAPRAPARPAPMPNHLRERPRSASSPGAWARLLERTRVLWRGPSPTSAAEGVPSSGLLRPQEIRGGGLRRRSQIRRLRATPVQESVQEILKEVKDINKKVDGMDSKNSLKWLWESILSILACSDKMKQYAEEVLEFLKSEEDPEGPEGGDQSADVGQDSEAESFMSVFDPW